MCLCVTGSHTQIDSLNIPHMLLLSNLTVLLKSHSPEELERVAGPRALAANYVGAALARMVTGTKGTVGQTLHCSLTRYSLEDLVDPSASAHSFLHKPRATCPTAIYVDITWSYDGH